MQFWVWQYWCRCCEGCFYYLILQFSVTASEGTRNMPAGAEVEKEGVACVKKRFILKYQSGETRAHTQSRQSHRLMSSFSGGVYNFVILCTNRVVNCRPVKAAADDGSVSRVLVSSVSRKLHFQPPCNRPSSPRAPAGTL